MFCFFSFSLKNKSKETFFWNPNCIKVSIEFFEKERKILDGLEKKPEDYYLSSENKSTRMLIELLQKKGFFEKIDFTEYGKLYNYTGTKEQVDIFQKFLSDISNRKLLGMLHPNAIIWQRLQFLKEFEKKFPDPKLRKFIRYSEEKYDLPPNWECMT